MWLSFLAERLVCELLENTCFELRTTLRVLAVVLACCMIPAGGAARELPAPGRLLSAAECVNCHPRERNFSHPVNVLPTMAVPAELPLREGRITCLTCHSDDPAAHVPVNGTVQGMWRGGPELCFLCHTTRERSARLGHAAVTGRAHLPTPAHVPVFSLGGRQMDSESRLCLSCHDGMVAREVDTTATCFVGPDSSHRIGAAYVEKPNGERDFWVPLAPATVLDRRIRLFDGRIGCSSCHSLYSSHQHLLVIPNTGSRLCLTCHDR